MEKHVKRLHKYWLFARNLVQWICVNFDMDTGDTLIRDFEKETRTCLDGEEQIKREEREKDKELEL